MIVDISGFTKYLRENDDRISGKLQQRHARQKMDEREFKRQMTAAECLLSGDLLAGYRRGLRRLYHGGNFGTDEEHDDWMTCDNMHPERAIAYRAGFTGKSPLEVQP